MYQVPALDLSVWPCWTGRPSDRDVDLRSRPRVLVRRKLRRRRRIHVQESGLTHLLNVRFRNLGRVVRSVAVRRRGISGM
jgi:hypothetical protein